MWIYDRNLKMDVHSTLHIFVLILVLFISTGQMSFLVEPVAVLVEWRAGWLKRLAVQSIFVLLIVIVIYEVIVVWWWGNDGVRVNVKSADTVCVLELTRPVYTIISHVRVLLSSAFTIIDYGFIEQKKVRYKYKSAKKDIVGKSSESVHVCACITGLQHCALYRFRRFADVVSH